MMVTIVLIMFVTQARVSTPAIPQLAMTDCIVTVLTPVVEEVVRVIAEIPVGAPHLIATREPMLVMSVSKTLIVLMAMFVPMMYATWEAVPILTTQ